MKWIYYVAFYGQATGTVGNQWSPSELKGKSTTDALNYMGSFGWELVHVQSYNNGTEYYFKQPAAPE